MLSSIIRFFLENRLVAFLLLAGVVGWGLATAPFDFDIPGLPRDPVPVDAIPDIGENQQIVFTRWPGRSPQDVEDQVTYPLTSALLGVPGVKSVRSNSMFGFSSIYLIFDEDVEFYWSRSRLLEKLNSLAAGVLPEGVTPTLGPDATALGQIYWYTLEGRDPATGQPVGGWSLDELRSTQDFYVRYGLSAAEGVAEVASIGGYVKEYQVDVDPEAMRAYGVTLDDVMAAIRGSNLDVGASTLEINLAEYFVRGLGYLKDVGDLEQSVVKQTDNVPVRISDIAHVNVGPAERRGLLDKSGAEAVGGVVIARFGANPLAVIDNVKERIAALAPGMPTRTLDDGSTSRVTVVPFYDRANLIHETIGTLEEALTLEVLITAIVVILMLLNLRSSLLVAGTLPVAVLMCFIAMRYFGVDANIVALSGIAIAIGTMVDMGIVLTESIVARIREAPPGESLVDTIHTATVEVAGAVLTAVATTVVSFLPVFTMEAAEGKLFRPLAFTKTFALVSAILVAIALIPPFARLVFGLRSSSQRGRLLANGALLLGGIVALVFAQTTIGLLAFVVAGFGLVQLLDPVQKDLALRTRITLAQNILVAGVLAWLLAEVWLPLGVAASSLANFGFVALVAGGLIGAFWLVIYYYEPILRLLLRVKWLFLLAVTGIVVLGALAFRGVGEEFMPALGEGTYLLMPTAMPHAGVQENLSNLRILDMAVTTIPEVDLVVGKAGRADTPLDPAPLSMYENIIQYKSEYLTDAEGRRRRFAVGDAGEYLRDSTGALVPDPEGQYFRQWRDHIRSPDDIWEEVVAATKLPGVTSTPKLQPIETRLVMLQTGMRAPMGIKIYGSDLPTIEAFGLRLEDELKQVEGVKSAAVFADRIVGKPYLLVDIDRAAIARYGLTVVDVQRYLQVAVGGMPMTTTVEDRERYQVRLRYPRELRNDPAAIERTLVPSKAGGQIPLGQLVNIRYEQGPQAIKSEDGFLVGYVLFDREAGYSEVEVVNNARAHLDEQIAAGALTVPAGLNYRFAGNYEQQVRASERLAIVVPIALALIFLILYFQFDSVVITLMVFSGVFVAFAGGFLLIAAYGQPWFLDFNLFGVNLRELFQVQTINLSVAVWVGFLALFGIATDDGVLVATFLRDSFRQNDPEDIEEIRDAVVEGGLRRVRPAMMTTATTILALLPVLTSTGRGADIMVPMAIPSFGGMALQVVTMFTVPVLWSLWRETRMKWRHRSGKLAKPLALGALGLATVALPTSTYAQSLASLYDSLALGNPTLQALDLDYRAALQEVPQMRALPDAEVAVGVFALPVETRLGPQRLRLGATQMLPWPGKLAAMAELANARAAPLLEEAAAQQLSLRFQLASAYFELARTDASLAVLGESLALYRSLDATALARVESGAGSTVDVYRAQLRREAVVQRRDLLAAGRAATLATVNGLLNRPATTPVRPSPLDSLRAERTLATDSTSVANQLDNLAERQPLLRIYARQAEISRQALEVIDLDRKPDFGVGLDYISTGSRTDANPLGNGRDALLPRVAVRFPINRKQFSAGEEQERLRLAAIAARQVGTHVDLRAQVAAALAQLRQAELRLAFQTRQLRTLEATLAVATREYANGLRGFDELIGFQDQQVEFRLEAINAEVTLLTARAQLARLFAL